jgi:two-component system, NarL family, sensor histidine kinase DegS
MNEVKVNFLDLKTLDHIIEHTVEAIETSKEQIFAIAENARNEVMRAKKELEYVKKHAVKVIEEVDELTKNNKLAKIRLAEVSKNFDKFSEDEIKEAYEHAQDIQVKLMVAREREKQLRIRRDDLDLSLRNLLLTAEKAEGLVSQVSIVLEFIGGNLKDMNTKIEGLQQKQYLGMRVIKAQEEERKRVAREMHDGPAQAMANIVLRTEFCEKLMDVKPDKVKEELVELKELVKGTLQDIRKIIFDLRPMTIDDLGLAPTLKSYITAYKEKYDVPVEFSFFGKELRLKPVIEIALFRIVQEALTNIKKHANATKVNVKLEINDNMVIVVIRDNGKGFTIDEASLLEGKGHYGLMGMRERVELIGGSITFKSSLGKGTEIMTKVPTKEEGGDKLGRH